MEPRPKCEEPKAIQPMPMHSGSVSPEVALQGNVGTAIAWTRRFGLVVVCEMRQHSPLTSEQRVKFLF